MNTFLKSNNTLYEEWKVQIDPKNNNVFGIFQSFDVLEQLI